MNWILANVFLTAGNKVGMQWQLLDGTAVTNQITFWREKNGKLNYSCTKRVSATTLENFRGEYRRTSGLYLKDKK